MFDIVTFFITISLVILIFSSLSILLYNYYNAKSPMPPVPPVFPLAPNVLIGVFISGNCPVNQFQASFPFQEDTNPLTTYVGTIYGSNSLPVTTSDTFITSTGSGNSPMNFLDQFIPSYPTEYYWALQIVATNPEGNSTASDFYNFINPCNSIPP